MVCVLIFNFFSAYGTCKYFGSRWQVRLFAIMET